MTSMLKRPFQSNEMLFVVRVSLSEFIKDLNFFQPCFIPADSDSQFPR
jgi:hypothetical protein